MPAAERQLRWSPEAESDLREIWRYYAHMASPEVANNILRELRKAGGRAAERPFLYRPRERLAPGLRAIIVHPYLVLYRVHESEVEIVRVLHERRDIEALFPSNGHEP